MEINKDYLVVGSKTLNKIYVFKSLENYYNVP